MQHGDATVEFGLHIGIAGSRKGHCAELLVLLADCAACEGCSNQAGGKQYSRRVSAHRNFPSVCKRWCARSTAMFRVYPVPSIFLLLQKVRTTVVQTRKIAHA